MSEIFGWATFTDGDGNEVKAQLRAIVEVMIYAIGKPGYVQYRVVASGVEMTPEEQARALRAAADRLETESQR